MGKEMFRMRLRGLLCSTTALMSALVCGASPAFAQNAAPAADPLVTEVIVTARKRQESLLNVPVVETVVQQERLERFQVTDMSDLPKLVPGLSLGHALLSIGTQVSVRGVGTSSSDPGVDQSVSLNVDGLSLGNGLAFQSGMFDVGQIEVLKGPQALFYGKSSPGGVIAMRTADPTDQFEVMLRAGYEFEAREARGELVVSGPITDTLKGRLAAMYSEADGYFKNAAVPAPGTGARAPNRREPESESYMIRGTLLWNPTDQFSARLKANLVHDRAINAETFQLTSCPDGPGSSPLGIPFIAGDACRLDRESRVVFMNPASFPNIKNGGAPFLESTQKYGSLELNYSPVKELTLTSTTALYQLESESLVNTSHTTAAGPIFAFENEFKRRELTQEIRANSDFAGPLNFTLGGFYQDGRVVDRVIGVGNTSLRLPPLVTDGQTSIDIRTYSAFGQARWQVLPQIELAAGARWTDEERSEEPLSFITGRSTLIPVRTPKIQSSNIAPELTLTYKPAEDVTLFAAYKRGYKSGSFTIATLPTPGSDNSFGDEEVEGAEFGLKTRLLDRRLLLNVATYDYRYSGLQVGAVEPIAETGLPIIRTINAGSARTYGIDVDAAYRPDQVPGLGLNFSVNWNKGEYKTLNNVPCYGGQTVALGCNRFPGPTGLFTAQDLSGSPLVRAPEWQATFGFDYEREIGRGLTLIIGNNNQYSSEFVTFPAANRPNKDNYQDAFIKSDLTLALRGPENSWEVALIGKNITDEITTGNCAASNYAAGLITGNQITGGTTSGLAGLTEVGCYAQRGRSVWVRLTWRPLAGR